MISCFERRAKNQLNLIDVTLAGIACDKGSINILMVFDEVDVQGATDDAETQKSKRAVTCTIKCHLDLPTSHNDDQLCINIDKKQSTTFGPCEEPSNIILLFTSVFCSATPRASSARRVDQPSITLCLPKTTIEKIGKAYR